MHTALLLQALKAHFRVLKHLTIPAPTIPRLTCMCVPNDARGPTGQLAMSPAGCVHYFQRETEIHDFFTVSSCGLRAVCVGRGVFQLA